jgi:hypothetical protein
LVEHWIVIPVVAGSSPVGHPKLNCPQVQTWGHLLKITQ